jgi:hypothetical protein
MVEEKLKLRYVPLSQAKLWEQNPKLHDLDALIRSIETHGFGDPPKYDAALGALVYGNGRTEALERMRREEMTPPRGVLRLEDGDWAVPVIFGVDAESRAAATAFAIDHNNLTLRGGSLGLTDLLAIWDEECLVEVLRDAPDAGALLASLDCGEVEALLGGPDFEPVGLDEQSRLDQKKKVVCPECGTEFTPR